VALPPEPPPFEPPTILAPPISIPPPRPPPPPRTPTPAATAVSSEPPTQRIQMDRPKPLEHDHAFDFANATGGAPDHIPFPSEPEPERVITDPEMNLPAPAGKYVFTRVTGEHAAARGDTELPNPDFALPPDPELEALKAGRGKRGGRRWVAPVAIVVLLGVIGGAVVVGKRFMTHRVRKTWSEDKAIPSRTTALIAATPSKEAVQDLCYEMAHEIGDASPGLKKAAAADRSKVADEMLGHWEALEDGRAYVASKALPKDATDLMTKCAAASKKIGEALEAFGGDNPPADTATLDAAVTELQGTLEGWTPTLNLKAPFDKRLAAAPRGGGTRFLFNRAPLSLDDARGLTKSHQQLSPDGRFLAAASALPYLLGGGPRLELTSTFAADGKWHVKGIDDKEVFTVSDSADYPELMAQLVQRAHGLIKLPATNPTSVPSSNGPVLLDSALYAECLAVNADWPKARDMGLATRAAHAGVSIALQVNDSTRIGDDAVGMAWALMAVARAYGGGFDSDEALLASLLGYTRAALALTDQLGAQEAVRTYLRGEDAKLQQAASARKPTPGVRYLWARRVTETWNRKALEGMPEFSFDDDTSVQSYFALLARRELENGSDEAATHALQLEIRDVKRMAVLDAKARAKVSAPSERDLKNSALELYENALARLPTGKLPVPFDLTVLRASSRARFYSLLEGMLRIRMDHDPEGFLHWLGTGTGYGEDFQSFVTTAVGLAGEHADPERMMLVGMRSALSETQALLIIDRIYGAPDAGSLGAMNAMHKLVRQVDARPTNMRLLLSHDNVLVDPVLHERLARRLAMVQGTPEEREKMAHFAGDNDELQKIEQDSHAPLAVRLDAATQLIQAKQLTAEEAVTQIHAMVEADKQPAVIATAAGWLGGRGLWAESIALVQPWVDEHAKDDGEAPALVRMQLARALRAQKKDKEAWDVIKPAMSDGSEEVRYEGALILLSLGQKDDLKKWIDKLRNSDTDSGDLYAASLLWRTGAPTEAGKALKEHEDPVFWETRVAPVLAESLQGRYPEETKVALEVVIKEARSKALRALTTGLVKEKHPDLAATVIAGVPTKVVEEIADAFQLIANAQGAEAARKWLAAQEEQPAARALAETAYLRGDDATAVGMPTPAADAPEAGVVWFLKAAAAVRSKVKSGPDFDRIKAHFNTDKSTDPRHYEGRVLLGLDKEELLLRADEPTLDDLTAAAFCRGVLAEGAGRIEDASAHYLDAVQFEAALKEEGAWARHRLQTWRNASKSLARLAAEGP
jgi:hypothetical protein